MLVAVVVVMAAVVVVDVLVGVVKYLQSDKIRLQRNTDNYTETDTSGCLWLPMAAWAEW